jgi:hypothetical protein
MSKKYYVVEVISYTEDYSSNYANVEIYKQLYSFTDRDQMKGFINESYHYGGYDSRSEDYYEVDIEGFQKGSAESEFSDYEIGEILDLFESGKIEDLSKVDYSDYFVKEDEDN